MKKQQEAHMPSRHNVQQNQLSGLQHSNRSSAGHNSKFRHGLPNNNNHSEKADAHQGKADNCKRRRFYFGYKKLEALVKCPPDEIILSLLKEREEFVSYLESDLITPDAFVLLFEVLSIMVESSFVENRALVLLLIAREKVMLQIKNYILQIPLEDAKKRSRSCRFWNNVNQFFTNVHNILSTKLEVITGKAIDIVPLMIETITYTIQGLESRQLCSISEDVKGLFYDLQLKVEQLLTKEEEKKATRSPDNEAEPPEDFRQIHVYPTSYEILSGERAFLRKSIIEGCYKSAEHYLDVHFRLLREDFVRPLREAIFEYLKKSEKRISDIKIHKEAKCRGRYVNNGQPGYWMQVFKPGSIRNLENSRRFMYGSLVFLTCDNFNTLLFGKITNRDIKHLNLGVLGIDIVGQHSLKEGDEFTFVEYGIYFEPYYQVLTALKCISPQNFPMQDYLVYVKEASRPPAYLPDEQRVKIVEKSRKDLNASQLSALNAALSQEFCIIQGPPGTGKTYLGLKIAKHLLNFKKSLEMGPMLVICYTNHALDQFVEGLLDTTDKLVRVGGQCKNEALQGFNLKNLRGRSQQSAALREAQFRIHQAYEKLALACDLCNKIDTFQCVVNFKLFRDYNVQSFLNNPVSGELYLRKWLLFNPDQRADETSKYANITQFINRENAKLEESKVGNLPEINEPQPVNNENKVELDDEIPLSSHVSNNNNFWYDLEEMKELYNKETKQLHEMLQRGEGESLEFFKILQSSMELHNNFEIVKENLAYIRDLNLRGVPIRVPQNCDDAANLWPKERWALYDRWSQELKGIILEECRKLDQEYRTAYAQYSEVRDMVDLSTLRGNDVVGMTTTGAARLYKTLQSLACPIVVVEEAAEVLEAHVVIALSKHCQHLILIGDHKQLKPSTADYMLAKNFHLGVSLFERMVRNGYHCNTLNVQHRMRPEISNLVSPSIYPDLRNHETVYLYPEVKGVVRSLYFIHHTNAENEQNDGSKENKFEAEYLVQLARYLVLNGYDQSQITILTAYSAQFFLIRKQKRSSNSLVNVKVCVLDNFQGEENDIILLSLVRNNTNNKIGFLSLENRVCVALSRAKHGFYIMGNMDLLSNATKLWSDIKEVLLKHDGLGESLTLKCERHPQNLTNIKTVADFNKVPEGGCLQICNDKLVCGHLCPKLCHNTSHDLFKCRQPCREVLCKFDHVCPKLCYEECGQCLVPKNCTLPCGHNVDIPCHSDPLDYLCPVLVKTRLDCNHETMKPCHEPTEHFQCPHPCETRVEPCGHACKLKCHVKRDPDHLQYHCRKPCARSNANCSMPDDSKHKCDQFCCLPCKPCTESVRKVRSCGHFYKMECCADVEQIECKKPCKKEFNCGHKCKNACLDTCGPCKIKVKKVNVCGHEIETECSAVPLKKNCKNKKCSDKLPCGHDCNLPCGADCSKAVCKAVIECTGEVCPCGHKLVPCHSRGKALPLETMQFCQHPCDFHLKCGHKCGGTCGECLQGKIHKGCVEPCQKILICGHPCRTPCVEACQPCQEPCNYKCSHSKCKKKCGASCTPCVEKCKRRCKHQQCTANCSSLCTVNPCEEPCGKLLPCGHPCIGFCGEPCPPLCRVCNKEEVTEVFFGNEDEEDARFVFLESCGHVLESEGLDNWFNVSLAKEDNDEAGRSRPDKEIISLTCPKCKSSVSSQRYSDYIKTAFKDIKVIKQQFFGNEKENKKLHENLLNKVSELKEKYREEDDLLVFIANLTMWLDNVKQGRRHFLSKSDLESIRCRIELLAHLLEIRFEAKNISKNPKGVSLANDYLKFLLSRLISKTFHISGQELDDFQLEIRRFSRILQLCQIIAENPQSQTFPEFKLCYDAIYLYERFESIRDEAAKEALKLLVRKAETALCITDQERREIVAAIQLSPGNWFKCPNGHIYCIGGCGSARQKSRCPKCKEEIGGTHGLLGTNAYAPEMNNATGPAYLTINNMELHDLNNVL